MAIRAAINGFGRIGRNVLRSAKQEGNCDIDFVAVNDLTSPHTLAHLLKYDSVHGRYPGTIEVSGDGLVIDGEEIKVLSERDPAALPWADLGVDIVIESTGVFRDHPSASKHIEAGARKAIISAPGKYEDVTIVLGVNQDSYNPDSHHIISNASCTTNCLAPVVKVLSDEFGFRHGLMTTIHAYTTDQRILDLPHSDLRRSRAAGMSMIPTTTGAAKATGLVLPQVEGRIDGMAIRVPTADVSLVDLVAELERDVTEEEVNNAFQAAADGPMAGVLGVSNEPLVSIDYTSDPRSSTVDALSTSVMDGRMVKVLSWYDNEWGYSSRVVDLVGFVGAQL